MDGMADTGREDAVGSVEAVMPPLAVPKGVREAVRAARDERGSGENYGERGLAAKGKRVEVLPPSSERRIPPGGRVSSSIERMAYQTRCQA